MNLITKINKESKETTRSSEGMQEKVLELTAEKDFGVTDIARLINSNEYKLHSVTHRTYKIKKDKRYGKLINKVNVIPKYENWSYDYPAVLRNNDQQWDLQYYKHMVIYQDSMGWVDIFLKTDRKESELQSELHIILVPINKEN